MKTLLFSFGIAALFAITQAQGATQTITTTTTTTIASSANDAVAVAKDGVDSALRGHIVSVYGVGSPTSIQTWWVIFYDPATASHGRVVKVDKGQIIRTYDANGGVVYADNLTFSPSSVVGESSALGVAQSYAAKHALAYDHVRALLRITEKEQALRWRVQLLDGTTSKGFVFINTSDNTFALYTPPGSEPVKTASSTGGGVESDVRHAANDVKNTFLGIGGDLEEFFTGERTVDK